MKVLVCGGRNYKDGEWVYSELDRLDENCGPFEIVIHGCATGADTLAKLWAKDRGRHELPFRAPWREIDYPDAVIKYTRDGRPYDARAGHRRNLKMLQEGKPDLVVAFPGHTGTMDMVTLAWRGGVRTILLPERPKGWVAPPTSPKTT